MAVTWPTVSVCIVTHNRLLFLEHSLELVAAQDYPPEAVEVLVVDDSDRDPSSEVDRWSVVAELGERFRFLHLAGKRRTIGEKRNLAVRESRHAVIVQWDDDDFFGPQRLRAQVEPIRAGVAQSSALQHSRWYFLTHDAFWQPPGPPLSIAFGMEGAHPGTWCFLRFLWSAEDPRLQYTDTSYAEPDDFQAETRRILGAKMFLVPRDAPGVDFIYVRHGHAALGCTGDVGLGLEEAVHGIVNDIFAVLVHGKPLDPPAAVSTRTRKLWARVREECKGDTETQVPVDLTGFSRNVNRSTEFALHLLLRNLERHRELLPEWLAGRVVGDHPERREGIRRFLLTDCFPSLLRHVADDPSDFTPQALAHAVLCAAHLQLPFGRGGPLDAVVAEVRRRTRGLPPRRSSTLAGGRGCLGSTGCSISKRGGPGAGSRRWTPLVGASALVTACCRGLHAARCARSGPCDRVLPRPPRPAPLARLAPRLAPRPPRARR
uniref:Glycosyltransferase 2-like domain-containing protein n=1 Tax=Alexandrium monilatum TaxID=311494 RepID=A0A7S4Q4X4_9DINO